LQSDRKANLIRVTSCDTRGSPVKLPRKEIDETTRNNTNRTTGQTQTVTALDPITLFRLFVRLAFLDNNTCEQILAGMCLSESLPATLYGRGESSSIDDMVRRSLSYKLSPGIVELVREKL